MIESTCISQKGGVKYLLTVVYDLPLSSLTAQNMRSMQAAQLSTIISYVWKSIFFSTSLVPLPCLSSSIWPDKYIFFENSYTSFIKLVGISVIWWTRRRSWILNAVTCMHAYLKQIKTNKQTRSACLQKFKI